MSKKTNDNQPETSGSQAKSPSSKTQSVERNLPMAEREEICGRWAELIDDTCLVDLVEMSNDSTQVEIVMENGKMVSVQITTISLCFRYHDPIADLCDLKSTPPVHVLVLATPDHIRAPGFMDAVGKIISTYIGKRVCVEWLMANGKTTCLKCADDESAWNVADHVMRMEGY